MFELVLSSIVSAPFYPWMGSSAFMMSYVRPVRFWERKYRTTRLSDADVRLASALDGNSGTTLRVESGE